MIIREPSLLVRLLQGDILWRGQRVTSARLRKSDTVFTKNLRLNMRSNLMLSPNFDLMSYAEKEKYPARKASRLPLDSKRGIGNRLEICSPKFLGYRGYTVTRKEYYELLLEMISIVGYKLLSQISIQVI